MSSINDLDIPTEEQKIIRNKVKDFIEDGFSTDEAIKKSIEFFIKEAEGELVDIKKQLQDQSDE